MRSVEHAGRWIAKLALPIVATAVTMAGCKSGEKPAQPTPKNNPVTPIVQQCDPLKYAEELHALGIPTPVGIGGEGIASRTLEEIVAIRKKVDNCEKLTDKDVQNLIEWNLTHPQKGEVPTPQSTLEPTPPKTLPTPTATTPLSSEAKKEAAPCIITDPKLCAQAERIEFTYKYLDPPVTRTFIILNLPEGTPLFSPVDGLLDKIQESGDPFSGLRLTVREDGRFDGAVNPIFRGDIKVKHMLQENIKKGDLIGHIGNSGITNLGASLLFTITKATPQGGIDNEEALRELFPAAFEKPVNQSFSQEKPGKPNVSISYAPTPPQ